MCTSVAYNVVTVAISKPEKKKPSNYWQRIHAAKGMQVVIPLQLLWLLWSMSYSYSPTNTNEQSTFRTKPYGNTLGIGHDLCEFHGHGFFLLKTKFICILI